MNLVSSRAGSTRFGGNWLMSALTNVYTWVKILCLTGGQGGNMSVPISSAILEVPQI